MFKKRSNKIRYFKIFLIYFIILSALAGTAYFFLFMPGYINSGIVVDRKENSKSIYLKLAYKNNTKWVKVIKKITLPDSDAYNVTLRGMDVKSITPCSEYSGKVLERDSQHINLDDRIFNLQSNVIYGRVENKKLTLLPPNDVIVGTSDYKVIVGSSGKVSAILIGKPDITSIRVGISNYNFTSLEHPYVILSSKRGLIIHSSDFDYKLKKGEALKAEYKNGAIILSKGTIDKKNSKNIVVSSVIGQTKNRLYVYSASDNPIIADSLRRDNLNPLNTNKAYKPQYYGDLELFTDGKAIRMINEVDIEHYLKFVVPSEIPSFGGIEGYKVQAIAARTYVLSDLLSGRFAKEGFSVDDTTLSQMYNSQPSNTLCDQAIQETTGIVLTYENKIIDAKYYSTSDGLGAPFNQVWYDSKSFAGENPEPYLTFHDFTGTGITDLSNEEKASEFFKNWTISAYDSNSPYFRWKVEIDGKTLSNTINSNIYDRYVKSPDSFSKKWYFNIFRKTSVPKDGIGNIQDIYISKRGTAGNVLEMTIVSDTGTYRIKNDSNIRKLLTPKSFTITPIYGSPINNFTSLPSAFFVIDKDMSRNGIKSITLYGGGYGHGVGMSQYGVIGLARQGKNYKEILNTFYRDIQFENYTDVLNSLF